jgi:hypothetical protein
VIYVGSCDDIVWRSAFWGIEAKYLLSDYKQKDMAQIAEYQNKCRFYPDEVGVPEKGE